MLTKQDQNYLNKNFATKKELKDQFDAVMMEFVRMREELYQGFDELRTIMVSKEEFIESRREIMGVLSDVMGELKAIREEQTVASYLLAKHSDKLESHDTRIVKLEESVII